MTTGTFIVVLIAVGVGVWFYLSGGLRQQTPEGAMRTEAELAADTEKEYAIAKRSGTAHDAWTKAVLVAGFYLSAKDEANYQKWTKIKVAEWNRLIEEGRVALQPSKPDSSNALTTIEYSGATCAEQYVQLMTAQRYDDAFKMLLPEIAPMSDSTYRRIYRDMVSPAPNAKDFKVKPGVTGLLEPTDAAKANGITGIETHYVHFIYKRQESGPWEDHAYHVIVAKFNGKWFIQDCRG